MEQLTYVLVTHSSYTDILDLYLKTNQKFFSSVPITVAINDATILQPYEDKIHRIIQYDDTLVYGARMKSIIEQIHTKYVLINHDSNIIVNYPNLDVLQTILHFMDDKQVDQMRLSDAGILIHEMKRNHKLWHKNKGNYHMSAMTAIWNRESILALYTKFHDHTMRCIECEPIQEYASKLKNYYISSVNDLYQMPIMHSVPEYFPTVHVTHLGKWTTHAPHNRHYIYQLAQEYGICLNTRGCM
jgi:hypothetical protein